MLLASLIVLLTLLGCSSSTPTPTPQPRDNLWSPSQPAVGTRNWLHDASNEVFSEDGDGEDEEAWHHRRLLLGVVDDSIDNGRRSRKDWRRTLRDVTGGPGGAPVLVTFVSGGYWPLARGWLAGLLLRGVTRFVVIPADALAAAALEAVVSGHVLYLGWGKEEGEEEEEGPGDGANTNTDNTHADFGSEQFHAYVANKAVFMRLLLAEGYHVFFADADVAWRGDPLQAVARLGLAVAAGDTGANNKNTKKGGGGKKGAAASTADAAKWSRCEVTWQPNKDHDDIAALLRETERVDTPTARAVALNGAANTGVFLLKPTAAARALVAGLSFAFTFNLYCYVVAAWEAELDYATHGNDQPAMNAVLMRRWKELGPRLCTLPPDMFPTGYTLLKAGVPEGAVGVHLNYAVGVRRKAEWAERLGLAHRLEQVPLSSLPASSAAVVLADAKHAMARQERGWRLAQCQLRDRRAVVDAFVAAGRGAQLGGGAGARVHDFERSLPLVAKAATGDGSSGGLALVVGDDEDGSSSERGFAGGGMSGVTVTRLPSSAATTLDAHAREQCDERLNGLFCSPVFYLRLNLAGVDASSKEVLGGMRWLLTAHFFNVVTAVVPVSRLRALVSGLSGAGGGGGGGDADQGGYDVFLLGGEGALYPVSRGYWDDAYVNKACGGEGGDGGGDGGGQKSRGCAAEIVAVPRGSAWVPAVLSAGSMKRANTNSNDDPKQQLGACLLSQWGEGGGGAVSYSYDPPPSGLNAWRPARVRVELDESAGGVEGPSSTVSHRGGGGDARRGGCAASERARGGPMHPGACDGVHRGDVFTWLAAAHGGASALIIGAHRGGAGAKRGDDGGGGGDGDIDDDKKGGNTNKAKKKPGAGRDRDPGWDHLSSPAMSEWRKVFVEPMPAMFKKLEGAVRRVPNATAVNAALSRRTGKRWMYCPTMERDGRLVVAGAAARLPQWLDETCSMDPSSFTGGGGGDTSGGGGVHSSKSKSSGGGGGGGGGSKGGDDDDVDGGGGGSGLGARSMRRLRRNIHKFRVDTVTVGELVRRQGVSPAEVQYVQVDAGGFDDVVVRQVLALGGGGGGGGGDGRDNTTTTAAAAAAAVTAGTCSGPRAHPTPAVIVYDTDLLDAAQRGSTLRLLHRHGYSTCRKGENTFAVRMTTSS